MKCYASQIGGHEVITEAFRNIMKIRKKKSIFWILSTNCKIIKYFSGQRNTSPLKYDSVLSFLKTQLHREA